MRTITEVDILATALEGSCDSAAATEEMYKTFSAVLTGASA